MDDADEKVSAELELLDRTLAPLCTFLAGLAIQSDCHRR